MKQQTTETTTQKKTPEKNSKEVLSIRHFYSEYIKEKKRYAPSLFGLKTKSVRKVVLPYTYYRRIVYEYLKVYFYEFYFRKSDMCFFLMGNLKKVVAGKRNAIPLPNGSKRLSTTSIQFFWYLRPTMKYYYMVKLVKLTGKTNMIPIIEKQYLKTNDKDLLPIFGKEYRKAKNNKYLYRCSPTL